MMILNKDFEQNISMFQNTKSEVRLWLEIIGNVILVRALQSVQFKNDTYFEKIDQVYDLLRVPTDMRNRRF